MMLYNIKSVNKKRKRLGRGIASGTGKTCGRGMNGQRARSGGGVRIGFEGGQMPLYRRLPRRGFSNARFKKRYEIISLKSIVAQFNDTDVVSLDSLKKKRIINAASHVKIVSGEQIDKKLTVDMGSVHMSKSVRTAIENAHGVIKDATQPPQQQSTQDNK